MRNTPTKVLMKSEIGNTRITEYLHLDRKTDEMTQWLAGMTREKLREMGAKGEAVVKAEYAKEIVTNKYVELVNSLLE